MSIRNDFDARRDEGLIRNDDRRLYEIIERHGPIAAPELRRKAGVDPKRSSGFEAALARLQMMTYVVPVDFIFPHDPSGGKRYGYGVTVFDLPERWLGRDVCAAQYHTEPRESFERMARHLEGVLPNADRKSIEKLLK